MVRFHLEPTPSPPPPPLLRARRTPWLTGPLHDPEWRVFALLCVAVSYLLLLPFLLASPPEGSTLTCPPFFCLLPHASLHGPRSSFCGFLGSFFFLPCLFPRLLSHSFPPFFPPLLPQSDEDDEPVCQKPMIEEHCKKHHCEAATAAYNACVQRVQAKGEGHCEGCDK